MEDSKLNSYLEVVTNCAVVLVTIVVLSTFAHDYFNNNRKPQILAGLQRGQKLDHVPVMQEGNQTLIIAMSTTCHYCSESIPF
jgi:hypothetical protein